MTSSHSSEAVQPSLSRKSLRIAAILEICGIYMVGQLVAFLILKLCGIEIPDPVKMLEANPNADVMGMSGSLAVILLIQYASIMIPAIGVGWWYRRRKISAYGFQAKTPIIYKKKPILGNILTGVVLFAVAELPGKLLALVDQFIPLGAKAATQNIAGQLNWNTYQFWVLMAVGSFALVPLVEELFYRGYVQTRLAEDFGAPTAILITAMFFQFSHGQYYETLSPWTIGMLVTGVFSALIWGYVFYKTRSLIAPIVAHVLVNFPVAGTANYFVFAAMIILIVVFRRQILASARDFGQLIKNDAHSRTGTVVAVIFMTLYAVLVSLSQDIAIVFSIAALIAALILEIIAKSKAKKVSIQVVHTLDRAQPSIES